MTDDPFDIPPSRLPTIDEIIIDNIYDLYDRDIGIRQADDHVLDLVAENLLSDTDKAHNFFEAVCLHGDSDDFVNEAMQIARQYPESQFAISLTRNLRLLSQSELVSREDRIIEVYFGEEAAREEEEHDSEVIVLKNYRDKKGV